MTPLVSVQDLRVRLVTGGGLVTVVDGVDFQVESGEVYGIAGESGSGKTISMLALLGLLPRDSRVTGSASFQEQELIGSSPTTLRSIRGRSLGMVFQDPTTSLHPMLTIGHQLTDHLRYHLKVSSADARKRAIELLTDVRIPDPEGALRSYPHQFSGGMRQRIAIAIALACQPRLLIADEPTTALDVTVQAGILRLLRRLRDETGLTVIIITHDLGVLSSIADRVSVFYSGRIVESGATQQVLATPRHPYTKALLDALPHPEDEGREDLRPLPGAPPAPQSRPAGCAFHPRCSHAVETCRSQVPELVMSNGRLLACPVDPFAPQLLEREV